MDISIIDFCEKNGACPGEKKWAIENCATMAEAWDKAKPEWLIWIATREGVLTDKQARLFACWCVRNTPTHDGETTWDMLPVDGPSRRAVEVSEKYAEGLATKEELEAARGAARGAAREAAWEAARGAAREAAWEAAWGAAWEAAWGAAWGAAWEAAWGAAWGAAWEAAREAAWEAQSSHLRATIPNPFK